MQSARLSTLQNLGSNVSDDSVRAALRSDAPLVVVEAPAGCGKTHQGADYAREIAAAGGSSRLLILTHTHAACSVFSDRTKGAGSRVEIRTIDSIIAHIAAAYHDGLGLPADTAAWVRQREDGYAELALKVAALLKRHPMIAASMAQRHPVVICDEHQDSSGDQHAVIMTLLSQGARVRVFADPMQKIFKENTLDGSNPAYDWAELTRQAQAFEQLDTPHRWASGCPDLGRWTLKARDTLKGVGKIDLRSGLPPSISIVSAENRAYSRPKPPEKAISIIHKAKGLECDSVIVMPCDAKAFPDKPDARCLLYVALSRAKSRLLLVVSRHSPSPLLAI
jgi:hypothetical protein